jgi:hypothetical protein
MPHGDNSTWIQTYTGKKFWPLDPRPEDVCIEDIAHGLAMKCRFSGHTQSFYSVAQHSVLVSQLVPPRDAIWGLLHDAAEAYLADVARPVKQDHAFAGFRAYEAIVMRIIAAAFQLPWPEPPSIKEADWTALATERRDVMGHPDIAWTLENRVPVAANILPLTPRPAKALFLRRYAELRHAKTQAAATP